jgi:hypothetical protein
MRTKSFNVKILLPGMDEENKIQDGEIISEESPIENTRKKRKKKDLYIELVLFFVLGILIGITLKTEAIKRVTIGYNDYQMDIKKQDYNINQLQANLTKKSIEESTKSQSDSSQNGATGDNNNQNTPNTAEPQNNTGSENPVPQPN